MKFICSILFLLMTFNLNASDWERRATGSNYVEYFGLVKKNLGIASLQMLRDYGSEIDYEGETIKSIQTLREFDCVNRNTKVTLYRGFSESMGEGEMLFEKKGESQWEKVDKGTFLEYAMRIACRI